jgi:hypothetical protein
MVRHQRFVADMSLMQGRCGKLTSRLMRANVAAFALVSYTPMQTV